MKKYFSLLFILLIQFVFPRGEKYSITNVSIIGELQSDGSMLVTEERTYRFKGKFKFAYQDLVISEGINYNDITVSEDNAEYFFF